MTRQFADSLVCRMRRRAPYPLANIRRFFPRRLFWFIIIAGCISPDRRYHQAPTTSPLSETASKEIFIGKEFFAGDELVNYDVVQSGALRADSLSYSIYQHTENSELLAALERCLPGSDAEKYRITDIVPLRAGTAISGVRIDEAEIGNWWNVTLLSGETILKVWKFDPPASLPAQKWVGDYSARIDYGRLDANAEMAIDYDLRISADSCIFSGLGYKTYFTDLCRTEVAGDRLILYFEKVLDGDGLSDHSGKGLLGTVILRNGRYFLKSPLVADKGWNYNAEILLQKK